MIVSSQIQGQPFFRNQIFRQAYYFLGYNILGLLSQVLETAQQVASFPVSTTPVPYDQMKSQCEALVTGKQQKMAVLHSFKHQQETKALVLSSESENKSRVSLPMVSSI